MSRSRAKDPSGPAKSTRSTARPESPSAVAPAVRLQQTAGNHATAAFFDERGLARHGGEADELQAERVARESLRLSPSEPSAPTLPGADGLGDSHAAARAAGEPLPAHVRADLEPRLGYDLGAVRIGRNSDASELAASEGARAFTVGRNVIFGRDEFDPSSVPGRQLIAHELVHVAQQAQAGHTALQRAPIERWIDVPRFDWTGKQQEQRPLTTDYVPSGAALASYEPETGILRCTFNMRWSTNEKMLDGKAGLETLEQKFSQVVKSMWERRYTLVERVGAQPTGRTAEVELDFKVVDRDVSSARRYDVDVTGYPRRPYVRAGSDVFLSTWDFTPRKAANYSPDDYPAEARPARPPGKGVGHTAAAHEFGHMIGLADEYPLTKADRDELRETHPELVEQELKTRNHSFSDRIMNVGASVTPDSYAPFALWLSRLTGKEWVVGEAHLVEPVKPREKVRAAQ